MQAAIYLCAATFSLVVLPPEAPLDIEAPAAVIALRESVADRRGDRWVLEMFARHRRGTATT